MRKILPIALLIISIDHFVNGQGTAKEKKWSYNFGVGYLNTKVKNENIFNDQALTSKAKYNPFAEIELSCKLGNIFNFVTGFSFEEYTTLSESNAIFKSSARETDADGYEYYPFFVTNFTEKRKVVTLGIPIGFRVATGKAQKTGLLLEAGIKPSLSLSAKLIGDGSYERKGYYPDPMYTNVFHILEDIERLDYKTYSKTENVELGVKSLLFSSFISLGITSPVSDKIDIYFKGYLTSSLSDITDSQNKGKSYISVLENGGAYQKTTLTGVGFVFGVMLK